MADKWIQKADAKMKSKGTKGSFGKTTEKKVRAAKKEGGVMAKKAQFAENIKKIAKNREGKTKAPGKKMPAKAGKMVGGHNAIHRG